VKKGGAIHPLPHISSWHSDNELSTGTFSLQAVGLHSYCKFCWCFKVIEALKMANMCPLIKFPPMQSFKRVSGHPVFLFLGALENAMKVISAYRTSKVRTSYCFLNAWTVKKNLVILLILSQRRDHYVPAQSM
jgi:hypothetical protein